jgi:hypothetical protein
LQVIRSDNFSDSDAYAAEPSDSLANSADRARIKPMCTPPVDYGSTERITEIAEILAAGLIRLRARKSSQISPDLGEISLDILADQSGPDPNIVGGE